MSLSSVYEEEKKMIQLILETKSMDLCQRKQPTFGQKHRVFSKNFFFGKSYLQYILKSSLSMPRQKKGKLPEGEKSMKVKLHVCISRSPYIRDRKKSFSK